MNPPYRVFNLETGEYMPEDWVLAQSIWQIGATGPYIWEQLIELTDKCGHAMYAGDVMTDRTKPKYRYKDKKKIVVWVEKHPYYPYQWHLGDNNNSGEYSITYKNWEIIGNIHQNSDFIT